MFRIWCALARRVSTVIWLMFRVEGLVHLGKKSEYRFLVDVNLRIVGRVLVGDVEDTAEALNYTSRTFGLGTGLKVGPTAKELVG